MDKAQNLEKVTNIAQLLGAIPGPQQHYIKIMFGQAGIVGSMADLIHKRNNNTATKNDYIDIISDMVAVTAPAAFLLGLVSSPFLLAPLAIGVLNYLDRSNFDPKVIKNDILGGLDKTSQIFNGSSISNGGIIQDLADYILQTNRYNDGVSIQIYDPLILDLNGNGKIDLTSTSNGVHFDHDANDISFKSSWVDKEDGLLVYDRNNNGIIDNGTELFGNFTRIASANTNSSAYENIDDANKNNNNLQTNNTTLAKHGYEALANLDSNNDGVIDINDKDFNKLRIWQDINKDGVSQTNELKTLDELNIKSLNLNYNEVNQDLGDNNTLTLKGSYTKTNGQTMLMGDINFNVDTINSKFKEDINLTTSQTKIPNVKGYGYLRDLNKAASIDTNLANILDNYSKSNTKEEQLKILPTLIKAWSDTSNNINNNLNPIEEPNNNDTDKTKDQREYDISLTKIKLPNNISISDGTNVKVDSSGNIVSNDHKSAKNLRLTPSQYRALMNNSQEIDKNLALEFESIKDKIRVIDAFSGQKTTALNYIDPSEVRAIIDNVNTTYDKILSHIYSSLLPQTRLKEYVSLIDIKVKETKDKNGNIKYEFSMDYSKVIGKFEETIKKDAKKAFIDIGEFINATMKNDSNLDASLISVFAQAISLVAKDGSLEQMQKELRVYQDVKYTLGSGKVAGTNGEDLVFGSAGDDTIHSNSGDDILYGEAGNDTIGAGDGNDTIYGGEGDDTLSGEYGDDTLYGNAGNDRLYGGEGNDTLEGGAGNDRLEGGARDDTYVFGRGDGADTIYDNHGNDTIKFKEGVSLKDLIVKRVESNINDLEISIKGTEDKITIKEAYAWNGSGYYSGTIENFEFADGTKLSIHDFETQTIFKGTDGNDTIIGANASDEIHGGAGDDTIHSNSGDDILYGEAGNDTIGAGDGNDTIYGGEGDDTLSGEYGDDTLYGNAGNDRLYGGEGNDTLEGGAGNDRLEGGARDDTYVFGRGDGADTIYDNHGNDTIKFKEGINKEDITFVVADGNLSIKYGDSDAITINGYKNSSSYQIEKIELKNGSFITNSQINKIVQDINAYASDNGIVGIGHDAIRNDQNMMNLVMSGWNS